MSCLDFFSRISLSSIIISLLIIIHCLSFFRVNFFHIFSDRSMELPPEHNSFRRLLAYRIAQRFGLTHAVSDQLNEVIESIFVSSVILPPDNMYDI